jgi:MerR family redox-sensitive transcriptional activator SoxR
MPEDRFITIGQLSSRTGVAVSAIRFYEDKGLLQALRTSGNQRRFLRSDIRRVSFILIAQKLGLALTEIEAQLANLPAGPRADPERLAVDQPPHALRDRPADQPAHAHAQPARPVHRLRLAEPAEVPALQQDDRMGAKGAGPRAILGWKRSTEGSPPAA